MGKKERREAEEGKEGGREGRGGEGETIRAASEGEYHVL